MAFVALVLSLFVVALGVLGMFSPVRLLDIVRHFQSPAGIFAAAALRIILGMALILAAPTSRAPEVVRILGIIILVVGLITPLFGLERFRRLLDWWSARGTCLHAGLGGVCPRIRSPLGLRRGTLICVLPNHRL